MFFPIAGTKDPKERMQGLKTLASDSKLVSGDITLARFIDEYESEISAAHIAEGKVIVYLKGLGTAEFLQERLASTK